MHDDPLVPAPATILIVDDDLGLLRLLQKTVERQGLAAATAASGGEAEEWLGRKTADLMLLDLKLRDMEGKELVRRLAARGRSVPFVIITGQGDERVAVEMMQGGALDYLAKDARFIEFVPETIRRALDKLETGRRLIATQAALEESNKQLLLVSEREQNRFGAELHDGLGQQLTAIELHCQGLKQDLPPGRADLKKQVSEICGYLRDAIAQTRSLARGLSPLNHGSRGLTDALTELAARMSRGKQIACVFDSATPAHIGDETVAGHLFRIAQEAVNNAVKHSGATQVTIRLTGNGEEVRLEVSDNGCGLPKQRPAQPGIGLQIMRHRASVIGARLEIESEAGKGATVICVLPAGS